MSTSKSAPAPSLAQAGLEAAGSDPPAWLGRPGIFCCNSRCSPAEGSSHQGKKPRGEFASHGKVRQNTAWKQLDSAAPRVRLGQGTESPERGRSLYFLLSFSLSFFLPTYVSIYAFIRLFMYVNSFIHPFIHLSIHLITYLPIHPSITYLCIYLSIHPSASLFTDAGSSCASQCMGERSTHADPGEQAQILRVFGSKQEAGEKGEL